MNMYNGALKNSSIKSDDKGDYIVVNTDRDGQEFKVYITPLRK